MGKLSELDADRQEYERIRAPLSISTPIGTLPVAGVLSAFPDHSADRRRWQRRKTLAQADRLYAVAYPDSIEHPDVMQWRPS
jgi:hypothetical protein